MGSIFCGREILNTLFYVKEHCVIVTIYQATNNVGLSVQISLP